MAMKKVQVMIDVSGIWNMEFDEEHWKDTDMQQMVESFFVNHVAERGLGLFDVQYSVKEIPEGEQLAEEE
jgi:hypothetical protein